MKVYVVMGNDYPAAVFSELTDADRYVKEKMDEQRPGLRKYEVPRIFYRHYNFELDAVSK